MNENKLGKNLLSLRSYHFQVSDFIWALEWKRFYKLLSVLLMLTAFSATTVIAQSHTVSGTVTDAATGEPLPGVNIMVVGSDVGTTTSPDGQYSLSIPDENETLQFSYIGYQEVVIPVDGRSTVDVQLEMAVISGDELLVVGYSVQQRRDMTGSIAVVDMDRFGSQIASGEMVSKQLQGLASGVSVIGSGQPGETPDIRIRGINTFGNNAPLVVIDGVPGNVNYLNSNDIANIQVLKDASSASIYGSRAANGVIVITTRKGGGKVRLHYHGGVGVDWQGRDNPWATRSAMHLAHHRSTALTHQ